MVQRVDRMMRKRKTLRRVLANQQGRSSVELLAIIAALVTTTIMLTDVYLDQAERGTDALGDELLAVMDGERPTSLPESAEPPLPEALDDDGTPKLPVEPGDNNADDEEESEEQASDGQGGPHLQATRQEPDEDGSVLLTTRHTEEEATTPIRLAPAPEPDPSNRTGSSLTGNPFEDYVAGIENGTIVDQVPALRVLNEALDLQRAGVELTDYQRSILDAALSDNRVADDDLAFFERAFTTGDVNNDGVVDAADEESLESGYQSLDFALGLVGGLISGGGDILHNIQGKGNFYDNGSKVRPGTPFRGRNGVPWLNAANVANGPAAPTGPVNTTQPNLASVFGGGPPSPDQITSFVGSYLSPLGTALWNGMTYYGGRGLYWGGEAFNSVGKGVLTGIIAIPEVAAKGLHAANLGLSNFGLNVADPNHSRWVVNRGFREATDYFTGRVGGWVYDVADAFGAGQSFAPTRQDYVKSVEDTGQIESLRLTGELAGIANMLRRAIYGPVQWWKRKVKVTETGTVNGRQVSVERQTRNPPQLAPSPAPTTRPTPTPRAPVYSPADRTYWVNQAQTRLDAGQTWNQVMAALRTPAVMRGRTRVPSPAALRAWGAVHP